MVTGEISKFRREIFAQAQLLKTEILKFLDVLILMLYFSAFHFQKPVKCNVCIPVKIIKIYYCFAIVNKFRVINIIV